MKGKQLTKAAEKMKTNFPWMSMKVAKETVLAAIAREEQRNRVAAIRANIESFLADKDFHFIAASDTNGLSIYYNVNGVKTRFSNHSVTSSTRIFGENHYDIAKFAA